MRNIALCLLALVALRPLGAQAQNSLSATISYALDGSSSVGTSTTTPGQTISLTSPTSSLGSSGYAAITPKYGAGTLAARATTNNASKSASSVDTASSRVVDTFTVTSGTLAAGAAVTVTATYQIAGTTTCVQTDIIKGVSTKLTTCSITTTTTGSPVSCPSCVVTVTGQSAPVDFAANKLVSTIFQANYNQITGQARVVDMTTGASPLYVTPVYVFLGTGSFTIKATATLSLLVGRKYEIIANSIGQSFAANFPTSVTTPITAASASMNVTTNALTLKRAATNFALTTTSGALYGQ